MTNTELKEMTAREIVATTRNTVRAALRRKMDNAREWLEVAQDSAKRAEERYEEGDRALVDARNDLRLAAIAFETAKECFEVTVATFTKCEALLPEDAK